MKQKHLSRTTLKISKAKTSKYNIAVLESTLRILECFLENGHEGRALSDLSKQLGLTKSRAFRILSTLEKNGYIHQDPDNRQYRLGFKFLQLGNKVQHGLRLVEVAGPILTELAEKTGESIFLGVLDGCEAVCVDRRESKHNIRLFAEIGRRAPLHTGTVPKILLAFQSPAFIEEYLSRPLARMTDQTITDSQLLLAALHNIRERGVAISRDDLDPGACSVGAPIRDHSGAVVAALSVAGPESRFSPETIPQILDLVREATEEIGRRLGCPKSV